MQVNHKGILLFETQEPISDVVGQDAVINGVCLRDSSTL